VLDAERLCIGRSELPTHGLSPGFRENHAPRSRSAAQQRACASAYRMLSSRVDK
jgi:hypothetical protein